MIKRTLKNYLSNLKYIFTPIGVLTIFVLIGLSIVFTNVSNALQTMINEIQKLVQAQSVDYNAAKDVAINKVLGLDWQGNAEASFKSLTSQEWLTDTLVASAHAAFPNSEEFAAQVTEIISTCLSAVMANIMILLILTLVGLVVGYMFLKFVITRDMVKRSFWKSVLRVIINTLINTTIIALLLFIFSLFKIHFLINIIITSVLYFFINTFESYLLYCRKKIPFKKAFGWKGLLFLVLSAFMVVGITTGLCFAVKFLFHPIASFIFIVTLVQIALVTNELLGESYMQSLLEEQNNDSNNENSLVEEQISTSEVK